MVRLYSTRMVIKDKVLQISKISVRSWGASLAPSLVVNVMFLSLMLFSLFSLAVWVETKGCLQPKLDNGFVVGGWVQEWLDPGLSTDNSNTTIVCR